MHIYANVLLEFHDMSFEEAQKYVYAFCNGSEGALANLLAESGRGEWGGQAGKNRSLAHLALTSSQQLVQKPAPLAKAGRAISQFKDDKCFHRWQIPTSKSMPPNLSG